MTTDIEITLSAGKKAGVTPHSGTLVGVYLKSEYPNRQKCGLSKTVMQGFFLNIDQLSETCLRSSTRHERPLLAAEVLAHLSHQQLNKPPWKWGIWHKRHLKGAATVKSRTVAFGIQAQLRAARLIVRGLIKIQRTHCLMDLICEVKSLLPFCV